MNGKPIDVEAFTDRAATSLYKSYSKGIFDGHSSFKIPLHYYLANEDINETFNRISAMIGREIAKKFGIKFCDMDTIWGNRQFCVKIEDGGLFKLIKWGLVSRTEVKEFKKDGQAFNQCSHCLKLKVGMLKCRGCLSHKAGHYCDAVCQKADWKEHKKICKSKN